MLELIYARPDDLDLRLVYADELQCAGDPRGELIAVQSELARLGRDPPAAYSAWIGDALSPPVSEDKEGQVFDLRRRSRDLLSRHKEVWSREVRPHVTSSSYIQFRRGFVEHVGWDVFRRVTGGIDALIEVAPLLRSLELASRPPTGARRAMTELFGASALARIHELYCRADALEVELLSGSTALTQLGRLGLYEGSSGTHFDLLADAAFLPALRGLVVNRLALASPADLTTALWACSSLRELQVVRARLGNMGLRSLAELKILQQLEVLTLAQVGWTPEATQVLFANRSFPRLLALNLAKSELSADDLRIVLRATPNLQVLELANNPIGDAGVRCLIDEAHQLTELSLHQCDVTDAGVALLADTPWVARLRRLDLRDNRVAAGSLAQLRTRIRLANALVN